MIHQRVEHILGNVLGSKKVEPCAAVLTLSGVKARTNENRVSVSHGSPDSKQKSSKQEEHQKNNDKYCIQLCNMKRVRRIELLTTWRQFEREGWSFVRRSR
jgi:hypothetical protein